MSSNTGQGSASDSCPADPYGDGAQGRAAGRAEHLLQRGGAGRSWHASWRSWASAAGRRIAIPSGFSVNLDGSAVYLTMASLLLAQAVGIDLSWQQQLVADDVWSFTEIAALLD